MRSDNMALYRDLTLYNFVYILLDDLLGEIRYDYSNDPHQITRALIDSDILSEVKVSIE